MNASRAPSGRDPTRGHRSTKSQGIATLSPGLPSGDPLGRNKEQLQVPHAIASRFKGPIAKRWESMANNALASKSQTPPPTRTQEPPPSPTLPQNPIFPPPTGAKIPAQGLAPAMPWGHPFP